MGKRDSRREPQEKIEQLDFSRVDPRIAERLNVTLARQLGSMPEGWMGSFNPNTASAEHLAAAEWDDNMVTYARALRAMARQADSVLAEVADTPENRAAIYSARRALLGEAEMYYDEAAQRPGIGLSHTQHWLAQTKKNLAVAREKNFSADDQHRIIIGRMNTIGTELHTLLGFVESGGWKSAGERERFCTMIRDLASPTIRADLLAQWQTAGGEPDQLENAWSSFTQTIQLYLEQFQEKSAPDRAPILGAAGVEAYLEKLGLAETPQELIDWCEKEAIAIRSELERLRQKYPDVTEFSYPENDAAIVRTAEAARNFYIKHIINTGIIPSGIDIQSVRFDILGDTEVNDLSFASIDSGNSTISCLPASARDAWSVNWVFWQKMVIHELTHQVQHESTQVEKGWKSLEAQEGAAVAMEWLATANDKDLTPHSMYRILQYGLRQSVRMKLGLQYHRGEFDDAELRRSLKEEAEITTDYSARNTTEQVQNSLLMTGAYWVGPRYIAALAKTEHRGNLRKAIQQLAHTTGLRLPGHVLIRGAQLDKFKLTDHLPSTPIPVQISKRKF